MSTLAEVLELPALAGARVVAGRRGLNATVRWCHVAEVLDVARLLSGGELLLTTGMALTASPEQQQAFIQDLRHVGAAGVMLELGRHFTADPSALRSAAERVGLPLISLPSDTPFIRLSESINTLLLRQRNAKQNRMHLPLQLQPQAALLMEDLENGRIVDPADLTRDLHDLGLRVPKPLWLAILVVDAEHSPGVAQEAAAALGHQCPWLVRHAGSELHLLALGEEQAALARFLGGVVSRLGPVAAGIGRCYREPQDAARSLAEARQTMRLRRRYPNLDPSFVNTGVYRLALEESGYAELKQFGASLLGPLLQYDRVHRTDLCGTLRVLLDDRLVMAEAARRLHISRQGLYSRRSRIAELLGWDLDDVEVRLALAVALRLLDVQTVSRTVPTP